MVGGVADGADDGKGRAKLQTNLCHGCAFHLDTQHIGQQTENLIAFLIAVDELVAAGDVAEMQGRRQAKFLDSLSAHHAFNTFT